jgi:hypothetical protein
MHRLTHLRAITLSQKYRNHFPLRVTIKLVTVCFEETYRGGKLFVILGKHDPDLLAADHEDVGKHATGIDMNTSETAFGTCQAPSHILSRICIREGVGSFGLIVPVASLLTLGVRKRVIAVIRPGWRLRANVKGVGQSIDGPDGCRVEVYLSIQLLESDPHMGTGELGVVRDYSVVSLAFHKLLASYLDTREAVSSHPSVPGCARSNPVPLSVDNP